MAKLIKIDKNGSKHYEGLVECPKCCGKGLIVHHIENGQPSYQWTDGGICWKCHGEGKVLGKWIERTPEYQAKLDAKRKAKAEAKQAEQEAKWQAEKEERNQTWLANHGFTPEGFTFLFLGDTYSIKDEIKEAGGRYDACGWHIDHEVEGFQFMKVSKDEILNDSHWGYSFNSNLDYRKMREDAFKQLNNLPDSQHIGEIGQKIETEVKYVRSASFETHIVSWETSMQYIHTFADEAGNILIWKTSKPLGRWTNGEWKPYHSGDKVILKGTIKEHSEYNEQKQTVMTRCKIA